MFSIQRYHKTDATVWNNFVANAKNATFLLDRNYMDYHENRFVDYSLLCYKDSKLYALLPGHVVDNTFFSHNGLTYGGLITNQQTTMSDVMQLFSDINQYLKSCHLQRVIYKPTPHIYHQMPAEEDLYAIFWQCKATLLSRNISTTLLLKAQNTWRRNHKRNLNKAYLQGIHIEKNALIEPFWSILCQNLEQKYGAKPVHTLAEINLLHERFPNNIIQFNAILNGEVIAGLMVYLSNNVVHAQYSSANAIAQQCGAMEMLYHEVINQYAPTHQYLDFGTSTEQGGSIINHGLISFKEGFGARGTCYDTYEWTL